MARLTDLCGDHDDRVSFTFQSLLKGIIQGIISVITILGRIPVSHILIINTYNQLLCPPLRTPSPGVSAHAQSLQGEKKPTVLSRIYLYQRVIVAGKDTWGEVLHV